MFTRYNRPAGGRSLFALCLCLFALLWLVGCGRNNAAAPTQEVAQATDEPAAPSATSVPPTDVPPTETAVPTDTATPIPPTDTPTATPTDTPEPTDTPTPEPTDTATPEPTDTAVPTNTPAPQPTSPPPPPPATAHTFPETPIQAFDAAVFRSYMGQLRDSLRSFDSEMDLFLATGKYGDCGTFNGWTRLWILQSPGFTGVPAAFNPLYVEYRSLLRQVVNLTASIRTLCGGSGGDLTVEETVAILDFLAWAYPRSEQMTAELNQIPNP